MKTSVADLRQDYTKDGLHETDVAADPFKQFGLWFDQALEADVAEPNAMTLATATSDGKPSARVVLLKDFDARGFVFYTNYQSRKGTELAENPWAALVFWWEPLERQVRVEGRVEKIAAEASDAYFGSRPLGSRLGAWASPQSESVSSRETLERSLAAVKARYGEGADVPRPPHWGGYRLRPTAFEFWQGRPSRLHDRLRYRLQGEAPDVRWHLERIAP